MTGWQQEDGLRWRRLAPFGLEIDQDLRALSEAQAQRFAALFRSAGLLVARNQSLAMDQQIAVMSLLGPVIRRVDGIGYISSEDGYDGARAGLTFHADYAFSPHPLDALSLFALDVVDGASCTRFANAERAYANLPAALRERLAAHKVEMISPTYDAVAFTAFDDPEPRAMLRTPRPGVLHNPRTGRACLGVSEMHAARLIGMDWEDSRDLLGAIFDLLYAPDNIFEHVWRRGDIVVWDNLTFQHGRGSLARAGRRVLQRVTVGEKPLWEMFPDQFPETEPFHASGR